MEYLTALVILCLSVGCCIGQGNDTSTCPDSVKSNYTLRAFGDSCLEFVPRVTFWQEGKKDCESRHGRLIEIRSAEMQKFTYETLKSLPGIKYGVWIGIDDIATQGTWLYSGSGDKPTYSNWAIGQPACFLTGELARLCIEDCGVLDMEEFGLWNDQYCHLAHLQYTYVCEYNIGGSAVTDASTSRAVETTTVGTQTNAANSTIASVNTTTS